MASKPKQMPITVGFVALGCPKNIVDSERMLAEISQAGMLITADAENADVVVINTCAFIEPAKTEALEAISRAVARKKSGAVKKVIVAGCLPQRLGKDLFDRAGGVDAIVTLGRRDDIAEIIKKTLRSGRQEAYTSQNLRVCDDRARLLITPHHWAYLRISEGCNHKCSFCTIPAIRGPFRSKPVKAVLDEALELVSAGVVELNIIAQDTTYYGRDLKIKDGLSRLLAELEKIDALKWIRLMYLYPLAISDRLIQTIAETEKITKYIDVPIQHINDKILRDMHRPDTAKSTRQLIEKLRREIPDIVLRTTLIVGFPEETESQFRELLDFVEWARFDALGCFTYYAESGTAAAKMQNQIPDHIKKKRLEEIMLAQQKIAFAKNAERIGSKIICLVDYVGDMAAARGRFYGQAPDIDSLCIIDNCKAAPGEFIEAKVTAAKDYDLLVRQI